MTAIATIRANVLALVRTLLPGYDVLEGRTPDSWFALNLRGGTSVVVSWAGEAKREPGPIGTRERQGYVYRFVLAVTGENWADPVGATYEAADVLEILKGSPTAAPGTPNLRNQTVGTIAGEKLYLRFADAAAQIAPTSTAQGGRFAWLSTWETNEVRV